MSICYKHPEEDRRYSFDFSLQKEVVAGETLTGTPTVTVTRILGTGTLTAGTPQISGAYVHLDLSGGTLGDLYTVLCLVDTSGGHTLACIGTLRIERL